MWTAHFTPALLGAPTVVHGALRCRRGARPIERERVTVLACVSTQFLMMLNSPDVEQRDLSSLRCMFTGGEAVPYERAARFEDVTGARVLQFYGSNETGALSRTTMRDDRDHRLQTAGRLIPEMHVRLLDDAGRDITDPGTPGHPVCKGPATCLGYLDDQARQRRAVHRRRLDAHRRPLHDRRRRLPAGGRAARPTSSSAAGRTSAPLRSRPRWRASRGRGRRRGGDARRGFGERVCLYAELRAGRDPRARRRWSSFLRERGVSPEWFPERLVVLDALPRASGGKVAKGELRADIRRRLDAGR